MVDYGKTISEGLKFSIEPKRWLPMFAVDLTGFLSLFIIFIYNFSAIKIVVEGMASSGFPVVLSLINLIVLAVITIIIWSLVKLYISGAIIHQANKNNEYNKSWTVSRERFWSLLAAAFIIGIVSSGIGFVPYVGWVFSIILAVMFFYTLPPIIIKKMKFDNALTESIHLFKEHFPEVVLTYILIAIVSSFVISLFMIPVFITALNVLLPLLQNIDSGFENFAFLDVLKANALYFIPSGMIFIAGSSITSVFTLFCQTDYYLQIKKKSRLLKI